jgi:hypothetical protein
MCVACRGHTGYADCSGYNDCMIVCVLTPTIDTLQSIVICIVIYISSIIVLISIVSSMSFVFYLYQLCMLYLVCRVLCMCWLSGS